MFVETFDRISVEVMMTNLEQTICARGCAGWRINRIHPSEFLCKVPHIEFALQLWLEWTCNLLLC